jgi:hypothetical protein
MSTLFARLKNRENSTSPIHFEKHQPERRRGLGSNLFCCGGCCCCCCCLHAVGGLLGAAGASGSKKSAGGASGIQAYWTCLTGLTVLGGLAFACIVGASGGGGGGILSLLIALMFLPFVQLAASIVAVLWVQFRSGDFPEKANLQAIGRITVWSILGAVIGLLMMVFGFKMFH